MQVDQSSVERVARAIVTKTQEQLSRLFGGESGDLGGYDGYTEEGKADALDVAHAAIAATEIEHLQSQLTSAIVALEGIASTVRLGAVSDIYAWRDLANACQETARTFLKTLDRQK